MCMHRKLVFYPLPATPTYFDEDKFKANDETQIKIYKENKTPNQKKVLTYEQILKEEANYARQVPMNCCFIDYDNAEEAETMKRIIVRSGIKCLILKTQHGYHFLFKLPSFYKKELTGATNWFGYKFDCKASWVNEKRETKHAVQNMRVCGMDRIEVASWNLDTPIPHDTINIDELDVLPYWLWGKLSNKDLYKEGKTGGRDEPTHDDYTLTDTPFTQLMKMGKGGRHTHIFNKCRYFACSNGFEYDEFKNLIQSIHDEFLVKLGEPMPESDLFGDTETKWEEDIEKLESNGWIFYEKERKWEKVKSKKIEKISKQKACEFLYNKYDFHVTGNDYKTGEGGQLCYTTHDLRINFNLNIMWKELREIFYEQDFDTYFYKEVKEQLIQRCNEDKKYFHTSSKYYVCKNGIASCISDDIYNFDYLKEKKLTPTDLIYDWTLHDRVWVKEHKEDLGKNIANFVKDLSRDSFGVPQSDIEQWLYVIIGASLCYANELGKIVILSGGGQNGKSIYLGIAKMLLGQNFYNESKIFDSSPTQKYWGDGLDKGICNIIDELPQNYNKEAFSYIKGGVSRTSSVEINPKYGKKKSLEILPQILCATNHKFELFDKSYGMRRRVVILPCCYKVSNKEKDHLLLYRLVMNLDKSKESNKQIKEYRMNEVTPNAGVVIEQSGIRIREQCVLDSLDNGSLCWFANNCRYMYIDYISGKLTLKNTEEMENLFDEAFGDDSSKVQCIKFINWYLKRKCGTAPDRDLSKANCHFNQLYPEYKKYCVEEKIEDMGYDIFQKNCSSVINKRYFTKKEKRGRPTSYKYIYFDKSPVSSSKKK